MLDLDCICIHICILSVLGPGYISCKKTFGPRFWVCLWVTIKVIWPMLWNLIFVNALSTMTSILWVIFCFIVVLCGLVSQILALWVCFQHIFAYIWSVLDTALSKKKYEIFSLFLQCETINQHHLHIFQLQKLQLQNLMNASMQGLILASLTSPGVHYGLLSWPSTRESGFQNWGVLLKPGTRCPLKCKSSDEICALPSFLKSVS